MKEIIKLRDYLLKPTQEQEFCDFKSKLSRFIILLGINFGLVTIAIGIQYSFKYFGLIDISIFPTRPEGNILKLLILLLSSIIIGPVIEEVAFRWHLLPTKKNIAISIKALLIFLAFQLIPMDKSFFSITIISLVVGILVSFYMYFNKSIEEIWKQNFSKIFYLTALLFGFIHIINHKLSLLNLIFAPIIVAPQLILGLLGGYLRVKYGFKWGLWLHIIHNLVFFGIFLFAMNPDLLKLNRYEIVIEYPKISNPIKDYSLVVEESKKSGLTDYTISGSEIFFKNYTMKEVFTKLAQANNAKVIFANEELANKLLDIRFLNKSAEKPNSRKNRHFVIDRLLNKYNVKATLHIIPEGNWILTKRVLLKDSSRKILIYDQTKKNQNFMEIKDATTKELADKINMLYSINCIALIDKRNTYNLKIPKNDINALKKILLDEYGLEFQKLNTKTGCFYIGSKDEKFDVL